MPNAEFRILNEPPFHSQYQLLPIWVAVLVHRNGSKNEKKTIKKKAHSMFDVECSVFDVRFDRDCPRSGPLLPGSLPAEAYRGGAQTFALCADASDVRLDLPIGDL